MSFLYGKEQGEGLRRCAQEREKKRAENPGISLGLGGEDANMTADLRDFGERLGRPGGVSGVGV
jgi:hypothetical protein